MTKKLNIMLKNDLKLQYCKFVSNKWNIVRISYLISIFIIIKYLL